MRTHDNRNMSDMEEWYLAKIEYLENELQKARELIRLYNPNTIEATGSTS